MKPVAPVGPDGEALIVIAVRQALAAGFTTVVVVVGPATEAAVSDALRSSGEMADGVVVLANQLVPDGRERPWGTVDALLAAAGKAHQLPGTSGLAVANGDDLYGVEALATARQWLAGDRRCDGAGVMFEVQHTMSAAGGVSRAVPMIVDGRLRGLEEQRGVHLFSGTVLTEARIVLSPDTPVSMNLWCLRRRAVDALQSLHADFRRTHEGARGVEHGLPDAINALVGAGFEFDVIITPSRWHGVTWPEDVARVRSELSRSHGHGHGHGRDDLGRDDSR